MFNCNQCAFIKACPLFEKITHLFLDHFHMFNYERMPIIYESIGLACNRFTIKPKPLDARSVFAEGMNNGM